MASKRSMKGLKYIMNVLLIFFAIPLAVIVISIALEKLLDCPILVAAIIFSILLLEHSVIYFQFPFISSSLEAMYREFFFPLFLYIYYECLFILLLIIVNFY